MYWYRTIEWALYQLPRKPPFVPPWNRIGTRYGQAITPLGNAGAVCTRGQQNGRVDILFVKKGTPNRAKSGLLTDNYCVDCLGCEVEHDHNGDGNFKSVPTEETRFSYCHDVVMHDGTNCDDCGFERRKNMRANRNAVWVRHPEGFNTGPGKRKKKE